MTALIFPSAAFFEIAGCLAFWAWLRLDQPSWLALPGVASLVIFAWLLTLWPAEQAGRTFAVYGGIDITASLVWLWLVDGVRPDGWDLAGGALCIVGAALILFGPRAR